MYNVVIQPSENLQYLSHIVKILWFQITCNFNSHAVSNRMQFQIACDFNSHVIEIHICEKINDIFYNLFTSVLEHGY